MAVRGMSAWLPIVLVGVVVLSIFVSLGYWIISIPLLIIAGAMIGGALLYWADGE
jgi:hypothetical protein